VLFLAAGSVITAFHHRIYDIYSLGNIRRYMPVTYASFVVGALALAGPVRILEQGQADRELL